MKRSSLLLLGLLCVAAVATTLRIRQLDERRNATGKIIEPSASGVPVGSYPVQMRLSPDGKWLVVTNTGFRQQLTVINVATGAVASSVSFRRTGKNPESLYWGLDFDSSHVYVGRGPEDKVSVYKLDSSGALTFESDIANPAKEKAALPNFSAGLAVTRDTLFVADNETGPSTDWKGAVSEIDRSTGEIRGKVVVGGFPLSLAVAKTHDGSSDELYATSEQDGVVNYWHPGWRVADEIATGANPTCLLVRGDRVFVSNSGSDTVSVIDTSSHRVVRTILLRPAALRGLPSCTPLGMDLSSDGSTLYVALADLNAVAVVDTSQGAVQGYFPVGWYPTDVKLTPDGRDLFVSNAKGVDVRIPNGSPKGSLGTYIQNIIEGTVSKISVADVKNSLAKLTQAVLANNGLSKPVAPLRNPGIKHVIYIIKENRTYDNVFGDLPGGNGDASLCLFPREVTPNQHALAERFVLLDNFYCSAEVSGDGWNWSTAGAANEYVSRNVPFNYSGRGRDYDFEGEVNGGHPDLEDRKDVAAPPGGYIWDACRKGRVSFRNYGFFVGESDSLGVKPGAKPRNQVSPVKKALIGMTDPDFNQYDLAYPDSELTKNYGIDTPNELKSFGAFNAPSRVTEWKREFDGFVKSGNMPRLQLVRFCRNHTTGTAAGRLSPRAMVADNDYAVGQLVDAVSHSRFWKDTVICIVEDDAQAGIDHVDCHRSIAFVISPFIKRGTHDSRFYNTDSMLRTMEMLLGMPPMNGFDAVAQPIAIFGTDATNLEPYSAIKADREIAGEMNKKNAYRSAESAHISRYTEESEADVRLNDILWYSLKRSPR